MMLKVRIVCAPQRGSSWVTGGYDYYLARTACFGVINDNAHGSLSLKEIRQGSMALNYALSVLQLHSGGGAEIGSSESS